MNISCPLQTMTSDKILMAHGGGGTMTSQLIDNLFLPTFGVHTQDSITTFLV